MEVINETTFKNSNKEFEVEIGDSKQLDFKPQIKLKRWDNECNFSCRLIDDGTPFEIEHIGDKVKCKKEKMEVHFYEVKKETTIVTEDSTNREIDCFEFNVTLKEKPKSNKIEFSIQLKELKFYYQPELTVEELSTGTYRPQNVIGSYAVYHKSKKNHCLGQKNYGCGKAFHIYRPKIFDSAEKWVWGNLNIDEEKGIMSVTIPQEFLDTAVYPIRHATGLKFGYETIGTTGTVSLLNYITGSVFTGVAGTGTSLHIYHNPSQSGLKTKGAIYIHSTSGRLTNGTTDEITGVTGAAWRTYNFTVAPTLTAIEYVLVGWGTSAVYSGNSLYYDNGDTDQGHYDSEVYGTWPATATFVHDNFIYSIYCTYEGEAPPAAAGELSIQTDGLNYVVQTI